MDRCVECKVREVSSEHRIMCDQCASGGHFSDKIWRLTPRSEQGKWLEPTSRREDR